MVLVHSTYNIMGLLCRYMNVVQLSFVCVCVFLGLFPCIGGQIANTCTRSQAQGCQVQLNGEAWAVNTTYSTAFCFVGVVLYWIKVHLKY
jgi:hypothetical protein